MQHRNRLDLTVSEKVRRFILHKLRDKYYRVILDMGNIGFVDTSAINMLLELNRELRARGYDFSIINVSDNTLELIRLVPALLDVVLKEG